jgi:hypothetical protein
VSGVRGHAFPLILSLLDSPEQTRRRHPGNKLTSAAVVEVRRCNRPPLTARQKRLVGGQTVPSRRRNYPTQGRHSPQKLSSAVIGSSLSIAVPCQPIWVPPAVAMRIPPHRGDFFHPPSPLYRVVSARPFPSGGRRRREVSRSFRQSRRSWVAVMFIRGGCPCGACPATGAGAPP